MLVARGRRAEASATPGMKCRPPGRDEYQITSSHPFGCCTPQGIPVRDAERGLRRLRPRMPRHRSLWMDCNRAATPLLASPQGGEGCVIKKMSRSHRSRRSRGGFPFVSVGKPPRPRDQRMLRDIFIGRSATPPCGDARRGITLDSDVHTFIDPAYSGSPIWAFKMANLQAPFGVRFITKHSFPGLPALRPPGARMATRHRPLGGMRLATQ